MDFYFPTELGERLAFLSAAATVLIGLFTMFAPGILLRLVKLVPEAGRSEGLSEIRAHGGFLLGLGAAAILFAQDWIYAALGIAFSCAAFARLIGLLSDKGKNRVGLLLMVVDLGLAALPLGYFFGFFSSTQL